MHSVTRLRTSSAAWCGGICRTSGSELQIPLKATRSRSAGICSRRASLQTRLSAALTAAAVLSEGSARCRRNAARRASAASGERIVSTSRGRGEEGMILTTPEVGATALTGQRLRTDSGAGCNTASPDLFRFDGDLAYALRLKGLEFGG